MNTHIIQRRQSDISHSPSHIIMVHPAAYLELSSGFSLGRPPTAVAKHNVNEKPPAAPLRAL